MILTLSQGALEYCVSTKAAKGKSGHAWSFSPTTWHANSRKTLSVRNDMPQQEHWANKSGESFVEKDSLWKGPTCKSEGQAGLSDEAQFWRTGLRSISGAQVWEVSSSRKNRIIQKSWPKHRKENQEDILDIVLTRNRNSSVKLVRKWRWCFPDAPLRPWMNGENLALHISAPSNQGSGALPVHGDLFSLNLRARGSGSYVEGTWNGKD